MADIDADDLPSVDEAKEIQRARRQAQADTRAAARQEPITPQALIDNIRPTDPTSQAGQGMTDESGEVERALANLNKAILEREAREQGAKETELHRTEAMARENADIQVHQVETMREQRIRLDQFEADQKRQAEEAKQEAERKREADARGTQAEGEIRDAGDRYRVAVGQNYDVRDPYGSLSRAAMAEYGAFIQDRERLAAQIAKEQDPEARKALELRREIEAADYMAITSKRIAAQNEVITGRRDSDEAVLFRERATNYQDQSKELRQQYRELATERALRDEPTRSNQQAPQTENTATKETKEQDHELSRGEISDNKADRIARIREQGRAFTSAEKAKENARGHDPGGRSR